VIGNESIVNLVVNKDYIFYLTGHHGHIWSLITDSDSCYMCFAGNTRNGELKRGMLPKGNQLLSWGFDSLPEKALNMIPIYRKEYFPFYTRMIVYSDCGKRIFNMDNAIGYKGPDSASFNRELNRLRYFMFWQASTEYQDKLPIPE